jgi:hypothetical protein
MATTKAPTEQKMSGFDNGLAWKKVQFRGQLYHLRELEIGEYDKLAKLATTTKTRDDGTTYEELDNQAQSRLMLKACLIEPKSLDITSLGTRLTIALNRVVNELHYGEEKDELVADAKAADAAEKAADEDGEGKPPNE